MVQPSTFLRFFLTFFTAPLKHPPIRMLSSPGKSPKKKKRTVSSVCTGKYLLPSLYYNSQHSRGAAVAHRETTRICSETQTITAGDEGYRRDEELVFFLLPDFTPECRRAAKILHLYTLDAIAVRVLVECSIRADLRRRAMLLFFVRSLHRLVSRLYARL